MPGLFTKDGSVLLLTDEFRDPVSGVDGITGAPRPLPPKLTPLGDLPTETILPPDLARDYDLRLQSTATISRAVKGTIRLKWERAKVRIE